MSENKRSFWTSIPGFVTGMAGLLTAVVGLVTVLIQLDIIGGDSSDDTGSGATTTVAGAAGAAGAPAGSPTTEAARFTVSPGSLDFKPNDPREKTVTVKNVSSTATLTLSAPQISGPDRAQFSASPGTCSAPVRAGSSCELRVSFAPAGLLRTFQATVELSAPGTRPEEVRVTASTLLGGG